VSSIAHGAQDPHYVEAKPSFIRDLNRADMLIYNGLELEIGWLPLLIEGARNGRVIPGAPGHLDASASVRVLEKPQGEVSRAEGDIHPLGNPHYLLDPRNGLLVARAIAERLARLDPAHRADYERLQRQFAETLSGRIREWERRLDPIGGTTVVAYHKTWEYVAAWCGIRIVNYIEDKPGIPPSPQHLAALTRQMRSGEVRALLATNYNPRKESEDVARRTGTRLLVLPASVGAEKDIRSYADLIERVVAELESLATGGRP
jgi:zinc/manganese transport system substrate-binding protein